MGSAFPKLGFARLWLLGAAYVVGAQALEFSRLGAAPVTVDTYYVVVHPHLAIGVTAAFLMFAAVYWVVETIARVPLRRGLCWAHFALTFAGVTLVFAPRLALGLGGMPKRAADIIASFELLSLVSMAGYALVLAGIAVFIALLIDGGRRFGASHPTPAAP